MAEIQFRIPDASGAAAARSELEQIAPQLEALSADQESVLSDALFADLTLPRVRRLNLICCPIQGPLRVFDRLEALERLNLWTTTPEQTALALPLLASAPWWPRLTHLELRFFARYGPPLEENDTWQGLWFDRELALEQLNVSGLSFSAVAWLLKARLPRLRTLSLAAALPEMVLSAIADTALPRLELLDVRFNMISGEGLQDFAQRAHEKVPNLREIGIEIYTGERVDFNDWNGAVVGGYDVQLSPTEIEEKYLQGTGLGVMREAPSW